ncbi:FixH family protein [Nitratireductor pacificus]|uniref:Auxin-binding protein n=1 Tax=Nitratireductor pacificus pht-3B TaxID=391937 RepID=K2LPR0_9HYPH|nr:FixH family protein [Nitratireductor pacificus]EKF19639.1 auxin-binding protein [Nitratireductor pacificus pht-3B]
MRSVLGVLVAVLAVYAGWKLLAPPPPEIDVSYNTVSADGLYQVMFETDVEPVPVGETHSWVLSLTTPEGAPVSDATILIDGGMPAHGHGLPTAPQVSENLGEGRYRIEGMRFNMGGHWEIRIAISAPPGDDSAVFNLEL